MSAPGSRMARLRPRGGWLLADLRASLVVFLVALPLSMGIAIASGGRRPSG